MADKEMKENIREKGMKKLESRNKKNKRVKSGTNETTPTLPLTSLPERASLVVSLELFDLLRGPSGERLGFRRLRSSSFGQQLGERRAVRFDDRQQGGAERRTQIAQQTGARAHVTVGVVLVLKVGRKGRDGC